VVPGSKIFGLNAFMATGPQSWRALRHALFALLSDDAPPATQAAVQACLIPRSRAVYRVPSRIGNYTDFYTSIHHARNVGKVAPGRPAHAQLPVAAHRLPRARVQRGHQRHRRSTARTGRPCHLGRRRPFTAPARGWTTSWRWASTSATAMRWASRCRWPQAEDQVFGMCLLNDWSARDIQFWEMAPLGPFLGKNFCTSVSPWIVTMEALAPYRVPLERPGPSRSRWPIWTAPTTAPRAAGHPAGGGLETAAHRAQGLPAEPLSRTSFRHQYWTLAQMVTQHTVGGCNLQSGDLLGTGTISGPTPSEAGAMIELSQGGRAAHHPGRNRRARAPFWQDGDTVILRGWCEAPGAARIGFGECRGTVLPAVGSVA
jgi:fumarylacetoacetase